MFKKRLMFQSYLLFHVCLCFVFFIEIGLLNISLNKSQNGKIYQNKFHLISIQKVENFPLNAGIELEVYVYSINATLLYNI